MPSKCRRETTILQPSLSPSWTMDGHQAIQHQNNTKTVLLIFEFWNVLDPMSPRLAPSRGGPVALLW
jgi:hypothetical protein